MNWGWVRLFVGIAILVVLAIRMGAEPFVEGIRSTDATTILVALIVTAGTTWCCAWRWSLLSERLDVAVPVRAAYRRYYRSQFLNATLPGGVLGDVHRGIDHGRSSGALGRGLRSVLWDRASGQAVQIGLAMAALVLLPTAARSDVGWLLLAVAAALVAVGVALPSRVRRAVAVDLRDVVAARAVLPRVVLASALAAAGHVVVFVVAARSVGVTAPLPELAALALVVLVASALPLSVAGWGPREGAAAWLFGAAGLGTETGLSVAVAFGVVSLVATLPGLLTLAGGTSPVTMAPDPTPEEVGRG